MPSLPPKNERRIYYASNLSAKGRNVSGSSSLACQPVSVLIALIERKLTIQMLQYCGCSPKSIG